MFKSKQALLIVVCKKLSLSAFSCFRDRNPQPMVIIYTDILD